MSRLLLRDLGRALQAFKKMAAPLSAAYKRAPEIAQQKSAHLTMWESALTSRHKALLAQGLEPEVALTKATQAMRLPPPRAKTRFFAEAIILSINIRNDIATVLQTFVDRLQPRSQLHHRWHLVVKWILTSVLEDAELTHRVAGKHGLLRYQLLSTVIVFRAKLAVFRCNAAAEIAFTPALSIDQRKMLAGKSENRCQAAWQAFGASFPSEPVMGLDGLDGAEWLEEKCQVPAEQIMADWAELTYMLRSGAFFQAVTAAEKQAVVQALQLGRGSWHQCPLGHPFAIGECGQAMETSRCPECGATIGGGHHVLVAGNSSSNEMNALVRRAARSGEGGSRRDV